MNYIGYIKKLLRQPIGAIPVGLRVTVAGVKLGFERQFEIDGKVRLDVVSDRKKVVSIDGVVKNKPMQVKKINDFILKNRTVFRTKVEKGYGTRKKIEEFEVTEKGIKEKTKKLVDNLSKEVREYNNPKKTTTKRTTTKKTTEKKINPDKGGFLFRKTTDGYKQEPKASWSLYKNSKLPNRKFFIGKNEYDYWYILDLFSGMSVGNGSTKKQAIESFEKVLEKNSKKFIIDKLDANRLPKKEMDVVMLPYNYAKKQSSKKSPPKKELNKKSPPKKESNKKSPPKKSNKRVITKKGKAGNLVYVGREKVGKKMLYQYEYKNIPKKK